MRASALLACRVHLNGDNNSVMSNHISESIDAESIKPANEKPVIIRIVSGRGNYVANNHIVATTSASQASDAPSTDCYATQVEAILSTKNRIALDVTTVKVEPGSVENTILDSGSDAQVLMDRTVNAFRGTPMPGRN